MAFDEARIDSMNNVGPDIGTIKIRLDSTAHELPVDLKSKFNFDDYRLAALLKPLRLSVDSRGAPSRHSNMMQDMVERLKQNYHAEQYGGGNVVVYCPRNELTRAVSQGLLEGISGWGHEFVGRQKR